MQVLLSTKKVKCDIPQASVSSEPKAEPFLASIIENVQKYAEIYNIATVTWKKY